MTRRRSSWPDPETIHALRDRPELLAIADAAAITSGATDRRRVAVPAAVAVVAVAVAVLGFAILVGRGGDPTFAKRALAAVGKQPVVHAILTAEASLDRVVELRTGAERRALQRVELWYDSRTRTYVSATSVDGALMVRVEGTPEPALAAFAGGYRHALDSGRARVIGTRRVDGRHATVLRFSIGQNMSEEVAVDTATFAPLEVQYVSTGVRGTRWRVETMASLADMPPQARRAPPTAPRVMTVDVRRLTIHEAAQRRPRPRWPGPSVGPTHLAAIRVQSLDRPVGRARGDERRGPVGLRLDYSGGRAWIEIDESTSATTSYGFPRPEMALSGPVPGLGQLRLSCDACTDHAAAYRPTWVGQLRSGGFFVTIKASSRQLVLAAARALRPVG